MANSIISKEQARNITQSNSIKTPQDLMGALKGMFKEALQEILEAEMDTTLGYEKYNRTTEGKSNYRNGYGHKKVNTTLGEIEIDVPRDRNAEFETTVVPKGKRDISDFEDIGYFT